MSPTEHDLRAALHDGEGDGLDADLVLASARATAARRRTRAAGITGAVVGVLAVATAAGVLVGRGGTSNPSADGARRGAPGSTGAAQPAVQDSRAGVAAGGTDVPSNASAGGATVCPATFPDRPRLSGGGTGPLFAEPVARITICGYGPTGGTGGIAGGGANGDQTGGSSPVSPVSSTLTGADAAALVASLESTSPVAQGGACPMYRVADDHRLAFVAVSTSGRTLPVVSTTLGNPVCSVQVTNGTVTRYNWQPTSTLQARLYGLDPHPR